MGLGFPVIVSTIRCDRLAKELTELVLSHIEWVDTAINNVIQAHERRIDVSSLNEEISKQEQAKQREEFVQTRKAAGWKRDRFDARRTQSLCKVALEELL